MLKVYAALAVAAGSPSIAAIQRLSHAEFCDSPENVNY